MARLPRMVWLFAFALAFVVLGLAGGGATASGEELVNAECAGCHPLSIITSSANVSQAEWELSVIRMEEKGMSISDKERAVIVDYLVALSAGA